MHSTRKDISVYQKRSRSRKKAHKNVKGECVHVWYALKNFRASLKLRDLYTRVRMRFNRYARSINICGIFIWDTENGVEMPRAPVILWNFVIDFFV